VLQRGSVIPDGVGEEYIAITQQLQASAAGVGGYPLFSFFKNMPECLYLIGLEGHLDDADEVHGCEFL